MPDYAKKAKVISSGLVKEYKSIKRAIFAENWLVHTGEILKTDRDYNTAVEQRFFYSHLMPEDWQEASRVYDANRQQRYRLEKRILDMLTTSPECVFVTLTFRDDVLASTSSETRRQYVRKWLKQYGTLYVANIDYGGQHGREHYHAVINARVSPKTWKYGILNCESVKYTPNDKTSLKLAKYVSKLTNHAIKETTKRCALIYSR